MTKAYESFSTKQTPQTEPIPGETQVKNNAGGFVYALDKWAHLDRFLILGSEGGTYYTSEPTLTRENAVNVLACLTEDGPRTVKAAEVISKAGRAPRNTPAEFVLALAAASKVPETRRAALDALPNVCRIPTHLFHFIAFLKKNGTWSRSIRTAVSRWYDRWDANQLAYEVVKYQSRDGWANRDVLRLAHPTNLATEKQAALRWAIGAGLEARTIVSKDRPNRVYRALDGYPAIIQAFEEAKTADTHRLVQLIHEHGLTREMVPTLALTHAEVWSALLDKMPLTALIRNLGNLSKVGLLKPLSEAAKTVVVRLQDRDALRKARVHPVAVLMALKTYGQGKGMKGKGEWTPVPTVVNALDDAFYLTFDYLTPTAKRWLFGIDVSGSMGMAAIANTPLTAAEGAAAMAMACIRTEQEYYVMGFAHSFRDLGLTSRMTLGEVLAKTRMSNFGTTDASVPMRWARDQKIAVDAFVVITDNETWSGHTHPVQELRKYRTAMGIEAKQIVMGMTATKFTIADPADPGTLDVVGFDAAAPSVVTEFVR